MCLNSFKIDCYFVVLGDVKLFEKADTLTKHEPENFKQAPETTPPDQTPKNQQRQQQ